MLICGYFLTKIVLQEKGSISCLFLLLDFIIQTVAAGIIRKKFLGRVINIMNEFFIKYGSILYLVQFFFAVVIGVYFWSLLKNQQSRKTVVLRESQKETVKLKEMRNVRLTEPLSSLTRPSSLNDVIGQSEGIEILRSALCGSNPQHVIIYGPPGVGKTAAARLVLEEAKTSPLSPFGKNASFVEIDATISRFDERNIADPLIGSVHDPIYQGAGAWGWRVFHSPNPVPVPKLMGVCFLSMRLVSFIPYR